MTKPESAALSRHTSGLTTIRATQNKRSTAPSLPSNPALVKRRLLPFALAFLSGLFLALSFPRWELFPLAWVAFIPLFFAVRNVSAARSFLIGWTAGLVYFSGTLSWVTISMTRYGKIPQPISYLLMLLLVAYCAVYVGLFAAGSRSLFEKKRGWALLLIPVLWVALEYARGHLLSGFPWAALAYSQYRFLPLIQIADLASIYGIGFLIVLVNAGLFEVIRGGWIERRMAWRPLILTGGLFLLSLGYGLYRLDQPMGEERSLTVAVVQGNIEQDQKWDARLRDETVQKYKRLSLDSVKKEAPPELIVWPESAAPFFFQTEAALRNELLDFAQEGKFYLLFGSPAFEPASSGQMALLNSAYLLSPAAEVVGRYDKIHLVPFGEYVPLSSVLFFVNKLVEGIGEFIPGREATVMEAAGTRIGTVICFEVIFPEVVRRFAQNGATVMTTITNDAWFGDSAAPYQHFSMVVFRSIENRVPFARSANTGISGFIDAHGRIIKQSPLFTEAALTQSLHPGTRRTLYTAYGDVFAIGCVIIALGFALFSYREKRRKTDAD
ncbi:apolipoprotein N-acyltransferase [Candidatus Manganitrophus noduliformans]|uniref:apolipoprotein N-acyltransferase n=1 Tax=Candidatus Manganitrophus noduliformans TaxID=2606439 RepID=UPI00192D44DA|nr:apolipoprotein N-acyltransferase [Candidatus Manganitrophus noduliformans]